MQRWFWEIVVTKILVWEINTSFTNKATSILFPWAVSLQRRLVTPHNSFFGCEGIIVRRDVPNNCVWGYTNTYQLLICSYDPSPIFDRKEFWSIAWNKKSVTK